MRYSYIKKFSDISMRDVALVGGKAASLGEMIQALTKKSIAIPDGFAITSDAYWYVLEYNNLKKPIRQLLTKLGKKPTLSRLATIAQQIRTLIEKAKLPPDLVKEISHAYKKFDAVAVRSSATAEDLPGASFAGQQESYLNIETEKALLRAVIKCMASLFTDRAIIYRINHGFDHFKVALSVAVQAMVRASVSGVAFSCDTETGFKDIVVINATYGLGESLVHGEVTPDEFYVFKPLLDGTHVPIVKKALGTKHTKRIYGVTRPMIKVAVPAHDRNRLCMSDKEVLLLAQQVCAIEAHYSRKARQWTPMDIEWAIDEDGKLFIIQARPETVHGQHKNGRILHRYVLARNHHKVLASGQSIGQKIVAGKARVVHSAAEISRIKPGEIIVTTMTDPDWVPVMKIAAGIITTRGGRTCHAAIVSRELGLPAIVGALEALDRIKTGDLVTIDCSRGERAFVYAGKIPFTREETVVGKLRKPPVEVLLNLAESEQAFALSFLPVAGVGLARIEFVISSMGVHPMALAKDEDGRRFFIEQLSCAVGTIAAAFWPRPVTVRFSDLKSDEYRNLKGGDIYEPVEENPMMGLRGAARYTSPLYQPAFVIECAAMKKVRDEMGFDNVTLMVPFVRTVDEAKRVRALLKKQGLLTKNQKLFMMIEVPANVLMIDELSKLFDGFSIGSNDLTQSTLAVDRESHILAPLFDERTDAVKKMLKLAVQGAHKNKKYISICGQAPSDYPEIAEFLIKIGIDAISLNEDVILEFLKRKRPVRGE